MAAARASMSLVQRTTNAAKGIVAYTTPKLTTFWRYARVEMRPPSMSEMPQVQRDFNNLVVAARTGKWKKLTVREAWLNTVVGMEIMFWFFVGEIIGKGSIIGYNIPGATHFGK
ncbi:ATP synthase subunit g, mitochondrial-like [Gigantopelta aegis]|uniref:ATP synthase subunit g, mitochondrial-like n=1 Tax=Gigantopelta aegis TaxID=1735272 RepID=UPI001B888B3E|nr:ATP synthase subunit g, mitochondrial-like [Gigantopelta aegis]